MLLFTFVFVVECLFLFLLRSERFSIQRHGAHKTARVLCRVGAFKAAVIIIALFPFVLGCRRVRDKLLVRMQVCVLARAIACILLACFYFKCACQAPKDRAVSTSRPGGIRG